MTKSKSLALLASLVACSLAGGCCYDSEQVGAFLREPRAPVAATEYRVMPPDILEIRSTKVPEINQIRQRVRPDGKINLPLAGEIATAGKTPTQIEAAINKMTSKYYTEADSTVAVLAYESQRYYVFGQVARPGPRPWTGHDTLLDALAQAQPNNMAWPERIILVRGSQPQEGGHAATQPAGGYRRSGVHPPEKDRPRHQLVVNLMAMVRSGDMSNNVLLMPNDIVYVQPNPLAKIGLAVQNLLFPIRPAAEAIRMPAGAAAAVTGGL